MRNATKEGARNQNALPLFFLQITNYLIPLHNSNSHFLRYINLIDTVFLTLFLILISPLHPNLNP